MAKTQNIRIYKEYAKALSFEIKNDNDEVVDLSGLTGTINVFLTIPGQDASSVITKTLTIDSAEKGLCSVTLTDTDTNVNVAVYSYQLVFAYGASDNRILGYGSLEILGDDEQRVEQIKSKYSLTYDYKTILSGLNYAHKMMASNAYVSEVHELNQKNTVFKLWNYIADSNFDGVVDTSDIEVIEYQKSPPYGINDLSANISSINLNHPTGHSYLTMDAQYPTDTYTLKITYKRMCDTYAKLSESIKYVEELYTLFHIFTILEVYKLQQGLPSRTINGVTIDFSQDGIERYKKYLENQVLQEVFRIRPFKTKTQGDENRVLISKDY